MLLYITSTLSVKAQQCPAKCKCDSDTVSCNGLTGAADLKRVFQTVDKSTRVLTITDSKFNNFDFTLIKQITNLKTLEITDSNVVSVSPGSFSVIPPLNRLDLSRNNLTQIGANFATNFFLDDLSLAGNQIRRIHENAFFEKIGWLDLSDNKLENISRTLLGRFENDAVNVNLNNNPFMCKVKKHPEAFYEFSFLFADHTYHNACSAKKTSPEEEIEEIDEIEL